MGGKNAGKPIVGDKTRREGGRGKKRGGQTGRMAELHCTRSAVSGGARAWRITPLLKCMCFFLRGGCKKKHLNGLVMSRVIYNVQYTDDELMGVVLKRTTGKLNLEDSDTPKLP